MSNLLYDPEDLSGMYAELAPQPAAATYTELRTHIPPVLEIEDGRLVLKLIRGNLTLSAEVGDGAYFFRQLTDKLIDPALRAYGVAAHDPAAPND